MPEGKSGWDETTNTWRYRVSDPDEFLEGTFSGKKITEGVTLTLAKRTPDGPTETQSIGFSKKQFPTKESAKAWLDEHPELKKPKKHGGEGMSNLDLTRLDHYVVVQMGEQNPADVSDVRELEGNFGVGVYALWSDEANTILAFAFEPSQYNDEQAQAWVGKFTAKSEEAGMSALDIIRSVVSGMTEALGLAVSHGRKLNVKMVGGKWAVSQPQGLPKAPEERPWDWTADKENAILDKGGWEMLARAHLAVDFGMSKEGQTYPQNKGAYKLPVAELIDGRLSYVLSGAQAAYGALRGARGGVDLPGAVKAEVLKTLKAIYGKFGKDTSEMSLEAIDALSFEALRDKLNAALDALPTPPDFPSDAPVPMPWLVDFGTEGVIVAYADKPYYVPYTITDQNVTWGTMQQANTEKKWVRLNDGAPVMLHSFSIELGSGDDAGESGDDGLIWKEILHPGQWHKTDSGRLVQVVENMIASVFDAWKAGLPKLISVPADNHHQDTNGVVPAEANRGFVEKLKRIGSRLFGGFRFTDPQVAANVQSGGIKDCSVYLQPNVTHPTTGQVFQWVLRHVLLTNDPLVQDLAPFAVAADMGGPAVMVQVYQQDPKNKEVPMAEPNNATPQPVQMSEADVTLLAAFKATNLKPEDVQAMATERAQVRERARGLEITGIVLALEGGNDHAGVVKIEGCRHYPVVVSAVEKALKEQPVALAMVADGEGHTPLDAVVLSVVNAIPKEGRMAFSQQPQSDRRSSEPPRDPDAPMTTEQVDALAEKLAKRV